MTSQDELEPREGLAPFGTLKNPRISHVETAFLATILQADASRKERARAQALSILRAVPGWSGRLGQLVRSAHECGTASSVQGARERFHALNALQLDDFLVKQAHEMEVLLWDSVYAHLFMGGDEPDSLESLFEGIRALKLLRTVGTLTLRSRPPSWYSHAEIPIDYPSALRAGRTAEEHERDTVHPISGVRALPADDLSIIHRTLEAIEIEVK